MHRPELTPEELHLLCERAAALSPDAIRMLMAEFVGMKSAMASHLGTGDVFADQLVMLDRLAVRYPVVPGANNHAPVEHPEIEHFEAAAAVDRTLEAGGLAPLS